MSLPTGNAVLRELRKHLVRCSLLGSLSLSLISFSSLSHLSHHLSPSLSETLARKEVERKGDERALPHFRLFMSFPDLVSGQSGREREADKERGR